MKTVRRALLLAWFLLTLGVGLIFALPRLAFTVLHPIASWFPVIPMSLLVATAGYYLLRIYKMGSTRK